TPGSGPTAARWRRRDARRARRSGRPVARALQSVPPWAERCTENRCSSAPLLFVLRRLYTAIFNTPGRLHDERSRWDPSLSRETSDRSTVGLRRVPGPLSVRGACPAIGVRPERCQEE